MKIMKKFQTKSYKLKKKLPVKKVSRPNFSQYFSQFIAASAIFASCQVQTNNLLIISAKTLSWISFSALLKMASSQSFSTAIRSAFCLKNWISFSIKRNFSNKTNHLFEFCFEWIVHNNESKLRITSWWSTCFDTAWNKKTWPKYNRHWSAMKEILEKMVNEDIL